MCEMLRASELNAGGLSNESYELFSTVSSCVFQQHHRGQKQESSGNDKMNMPYILNRTLPN